MKKYFCLYFTLALAVNNIIIAQDSLYNKFEFNHINYGFSTKTILSDPELTYVDTGKGENTIVLIHGLGSNAGFWRYNIPALSKSNRVIAIDLPGYGKSSKGDYTYNMSYFSSVLKKFFVRLNIKSFYLVGHSMGGQISINFALSCPEYVKKLILISPAGIESFSEDQSNLSKMFVTPSSVKLSDNETIKKNISINFYKWDDKYNWLIEERINVTSASDFDAYTEAVSKSVAGMLAEPTSGLLNNLQIPTMIIYGTKDNLIPNKYFHPNLTTDELYKSAAKKIINCSVYPVENAGHLVMIEEPGKINQAILNFVEK